jgi:hypothetical protein
MRAITKRLCGLELRRRERTPAVANGDARRLMEERLNAIHLRLQAAIDCGECEAPNCTFEEVQRMIHAHLEGSRIRREENEKRIAERRWASGFSGSSWWT